MVGRRSLSQDRDELEKTPSIGKLSEREAPSMTHSRNGRGNS